jgi:hypothetical protein
MLRPTQDLMNLTIVTHGNATAATKDALGDVKDLYFDDAAWVIRYLVVETGSWLSSRKVLISPIAAGQPDWDNQLLPVSLTREQVGNSPNIDTDKPVTRQHETDYLDYYRYPYHWVDTSLWGKGGYSTLLMPGYVGYGSIPEPRADAESDQARAQARQQGNDPHLRSCKAVVGYHIEASDGEIGHVQGLLVDEETWAIRYLVVSTSNWWLGHDVLVAPQWIKSVNWADKTVSVDLTRDAIQRAPWFDPALPLTRGMEMAVYQHYGRPEYWSDEAAPQDRAGLAGLDG